MTRRWAASTAAIRWAAPLFFNDNPYVYAGNNPLSNVDPSGQYRAFGHGASVTPEGWNATKQAFGHNLSVQSVAGTPSCGGCNAVTLQGSPTPQVDGFGCPMGHQACDAQQLASNVAFQFSTIDTALKTIAIVLGILTAVAALPFTPGTAFAPFLLFLTVASATMDVLAGQLAAAFNRESTEPEGWFTQSNFGGFSTSVGVTIASMLGFSTIIGDAFMVLTPFITFPPVLAALAPVIGSLLVAGGAGIRVGSLVAVSAFGMMARANIQQQANVLFG